MLSALLAAYVIDVKAVSLRRERKQIKVIRKIGFHYRISIKKSDAVNRKKFCCNR